MNTPRVNLSDLNALCKLFRTVFPDLKDDCIWMCPAAYNQLLESVNVQPCLVDTKQSVGFSGMKIFKDETLGYPTLWEIGHFEWDSDTSRMLKIVTKRGTSR